jgi:hypothetical protein
MVCYADVHLHKISDMMKSMTFVCLSTLRSVPLGDARFRSES